MSVTKTGFAFHSYSLFPLLGAIALFSSGLTAQPRFNTERTLDQSTLATDVAVATDVAARAEVPRQDVIQLTREESLAVINTGRLPDNILAVIESPVTIGDAIPDGKTTVSFSPSGGLIIKKPDGFIYEYSEQGLRSVTAPDGQKMAIAMMNLAPEPPLFPQGSSDAEWLESMNLWLNNLSKKQLENLENLLVDEESFNNYRGFEDSNAESLYQRIEMRERYLAIVIDNLFAGEK